MIIVKPANEKLTRARVIERTRQTERQIETEKSKFTIFVVSLFFFYDREMYVQSL